MTNADLSLTWCHMSFENDSIKLSFCVQIFGIYLIGAKFKSRRVYVFLKFKHIFLKCNTNTTEEECDLH